MNQFRQILKNTAVLGAARMIERAGSLILAFFVARILHAPGLGDYAIATALHDLITLSAQMGSANLLIREIGKAHENTNRYFVHLTVMSSGLAAIGMVLFATALPHLGYSATMTQALYVIVFAFIPGTLIGLQEGVFVAHQRVEFVAYTTTIAAIVNIGVSLFLLVNGHGVVSLIVAFVVVQWTVMLCYFFFIQRYITSLRWAFELAFARKLLQEIKSFAAISILAAVFSRPEVIILSLISTEAQIGFYSAALKVVAVLEYIPAIYMTNVFPVLSRAYHLGGLQAQVIRNQSMKYLLSISLPLTVAVFVAAGPIVSLMFGPGFEPSASALRWLIFDLPLASLFAVLWRALMARGEQGLVLRAMTIVTVTELVTGYLLILNWASLGAAINTPLISLFYVVLLTLYIRRDGTPLPLVRTSWRFALAALGMGVLMAGFIQYIPLWALLPLGIVIYLTLVILFKALSPDDIAFFRSILQSTIGPKYTPHEEW
jgi:O-antigen/teichoic acid export membrane protein